MMLYFFVNSLAAKINGFSAQQQEIYWDSLKVDG